MRFILSWAARKRRTEMKRESSTLEKNPVVRTAKWAVSMMKNKLIASLILLIQGILFIVSPAGNLQGMVQIGAAVVILACVINILIFISRCRRFMFRTRSSMSWSLSVHSTRSSAYTSSGRYGTP